ncbi:SIMPL domain-containing protein [Phenylobacterium sp. LjRoot225]|uniref:SIMPL domain-containing protein n=1 Tax=Phenylobacterium sp. LjRoot225 TaxID=3342285 RepID=UPI003ED08220
MKTMMRAAALSLVLAAAAAPAAFAQTAPATGADAVFRATTLNLSAYGETKLAPDMATISLGVSTEAATAQAAMQANATQMNQVMAALKRGGIAAKDIQTSQLSVEPQYVYEQNQPPKLNGYRATNQVTVTVHDLSKLGQAVDATVAGGANQVGGISFGLEDPTAAENAAREKAVKALAAKADLYAKATGHRVLRLVSLNEGSSYSPPQPMPMVAMSARFKEADTAVSPGEVRVRVDISGLYELAR